VVHIATLPDAEEAVNAGADVTGALIREGQIRSGFRAPGGTAPRLCHRDVDSAPEAFAAQAAVNR